MSKIFRKEVLEKLQSPDRLNEMVKITSMKSWLALVGIAGILVSMLVWGIFGEIPENISGRGILIQPGGIIEVSSTSSGTIDEIIKREGENVLKDEVVATLHLPELEMQIENIQKKLEGMRKYYSDLETFDEKDLVMRKDLIRQKKKLQLEIIESNEIQIAFYENKIIQLEELRTDGLITEETLMETRDTRLKLIQKNKSLKSESQGIDIKIFETEQYRYSEEQEMSLQISESERKLDELNSLLNLNAKIISPVNGRVIELLANTGNHIRLGEIVMKLEPSSDIKDLEAITYVSSIEGKRIELGMPVKLSPSTVEVEEFGFINATVIYVSEYPSSYRGMLRVLGNENLAMSFMTEDGPPIAVRLSLNTNSNTPSGFDWTSGKGPDIKIRTGTMCQVKIEVKKSRPIEILFVKLK